MVVEALGSSSKRPIRNCSASPTYYIYEEGKLVKKIPQTALENFIKMNVANSQVLAKDIQ